MDGTSSLRAARRNIVRPSLMGIMALGQGCSFMAGALRNGSISWASKVYLSLVTRSGKEMCMVERLLVMNGFNTRPQGDSGELFDWQMPPPWAARSLDATTDGSRTNTQISSTGGTVRIWAFLASSSSGTGRINSAPTICWRYLRTVVSQYFLVI